MRNGQYFLITKFELGSFQFSNSDFKGVPDSQLVGQNGNVSIFIQIVVGFSVRWFNKFLYCVTVPIFQRDCCHFFCSRTSQWRSFVELRAMVWCTLSRLVDDKGRGKKLATPRSRVSWRDDVSNLLNGLRMSNTRFCSHTN